MKLYIFYLVANGLVSSKDYPTISYEKVQDIGGMKCFLYAFTPDKYIRNEFRYYRNMEIFYEKTIKIDRDDFEDFVDNNSEYLLEKRVITTKKVINGHFRLGSTFVVCTQEEFDITFSNAYNLIEEELGKALNNSMLYDESLFKNKYIKILNNIFRFSEMVYLLSPYEELPWEPGDIDYFSIFIKIFKNTYKRKEESYESLEVL